MNSADLASKLNEAISIEFGGVLQYNQYSHVLLGPERRVWQTFFHDQSMAAFAHAQRFAAKVVALGGTPTLQAQPVVETSDLTEMLQNSLALEQQGVAVYTEALAIADDNAGYRSLLEEQIREEMDRVEELQKYLNQVEPVPTGMAIGMNLADLAYYQPYFIYNDALRNWGKFFEPGGTANVVWDANGYPNSLNGSMVRANLATDMAHRPASFMLTFSGVGTVAVDGATHQNTNAATPYSNIVNVSPSLAPIVVEIRTMPDPAHPIRNLHLYMPKPTGGFYTGEENHPFHDDFVALMSPFRVIRFMDTGKTNDSNVEFWSHQTPDGWQFHADGGKHTNGAEGFITQATIVPVGTRLGVWGNDAGRHIARCTTSVAHGLRTGESIRVTEAGFYEPPRGVPVAIVSSTSLEIEVTWNFGTKTGSFPWQIIQQSGMSYEDMCRLCNVCQADAWVCIPWFADDDYVENMAIVIKATLAASRKVYVELSNEVWNGIFAQFMAAHAISTTSVYQAYAERAKAKLNLFRSTFAADSRVVRVYSGQHGNPALADLALTEITPSDIEAFAIAPYMIPAHPDPLTAEQLATNVLAAVNDPAWYDNIVAHGTTLANFAPNAKLICYEGGQHTDLDTVNDSIVQAAMVHPKMQEAYEVCLTKTEQAGVDLFCFYNMGTVAKDSQSWSHVPWMDVDPNDYPRYTVLVDAA